MQSQRILVAAKLCALAALLMATVLWPSRDPAAATGSNSITSPDTADDVGRHTSLELDRDGYPVISYRDYTNGRLKVLHCDDPNCAGDESGNITSPDAGGGFTSLELDADGYPVISYYDWGTGDLRVLHCDDPKCAGDESGNIKSPDTADDVGWDTSLELDADGYPVISYFYEPDKDLRVLHCDDPYCAGDESGNIKSPDTADDVGLDTSLELDSNGYPVVSYLDSSGGNLKVLHCDDPKCAGDESGNITSPDTGGVVGRFTSLELDGSGYPVVSYHDEANGNLKVLHCDDPNCAGDESGNITSPDAGVDVGEATSLELDRKGYPVVSYLDNGNWHLRVLHCDDPNCAGDESGNITSPDTGAGEGVITYSTSLKLDAKGNPVVSYYDGTNGDLKVLHCVNRLCTETADSDLDGCTDVAEQQPKSNASTGGARDPKNPWDFYDVAGPYVGPAHSWPPDQYIDLPNDILGVILKYQQRPEDTTTVSGQHDIGVSLLNVASVPDLNPRQGGVYSGDVIVIDPGGKNEEFGKVTEPITGSQLTLTLPTTKKHVDGETVRAYIWSYDRGPSTGPNLWNLTGPDGHIDLFNDILGVISQYQHDCRLP